MAPEQAAGAEVDGRTDLYTLGIVFYEMLTGNPPFDGDEPGALLKQHLVAKVPPLKEKIPTLKVPDALEALIQRLLEKRPDKRVESARQLLEAIEKIMTSEGLRYDPSTPGMQLNLSSSGGVRVSRPAHTADFDRHIRANRGWDASACASGRRSWAVGAYPKHTETRRRP